MAILANLIVGMWRRWVHDLPNGSSGGLRKGHLVEVTHESLTGTHDGGAAAMTEAIHQAKYSPPTTTMHAHPTPLHCFVARVCSLL